MTVMSRYVHEMTFPEIVKISLTLFVCNLGTLSLIAFVPTAPAVLLVRAAESTGLPWPQYIGVNVALTLLLLLVGAALTLAVSDICLGRKPGFFDTYARLGKRLRKCAGTYLSCTLIFYAGLVLLVLPGLIAMALLMFVPAVTIIERNSGLTAMRRSIALGKGCYLRNMGVVMGILAIVLLITIVVALPVAMVMPLFTENYPVWFNEESATEILFYLFYPISIIGFVLLYYDMRARKENYDAMALAADLYK